jgi:hypothetical protein
MLGASIGVGPGTGLSSVDSSETLGASASSASASGDSETSGILRFFGFDLRGLGNFWCLRLFGFGLGGLGRSFGARLFLVFGGGLVGGGGLYGGVGRRSLGRLLDGLGRLGRRVFVLSGHKWLGYLRKELLHARGRRHRQANSTAP